MGRVHHHSAHRLFWLPLLAGASAWPACSRTPSAIEPHSAAAPQTRASSKTDRGATAAPVAACANGVDVTLLGWDEPASADFGAVRTLTSARGEMLDRIWYASPGSDEVHAKQRSSTVAEPLELSLPAQLRFPSELRASEDGERVGIVATTWTAAEDSELAFTVLGADGRFSQPLRVDPSALSDDQPQIAAGGRGTFALVWRRGVSAPPYWVTPYSVEFALVDSERVRVRSTLVRDVPARAVALVRSEAGYIALYAPKLGSPPPWLAARSGSAGRAAETSDHSALIALFLDDRGQLLGQQGLLAGKELSGFQAAWDGKGVGVVYGRGSSLGFLRLGSRPSPVTARTEILTLADEDAELVPSSLAFVNGLYWVGATRRYDPTLGEPPEAYVLAVGTDGSHTAASTLPAGAEGATSPALVSTGARVHGLFFADPTSPTPRLKGFEASCREQAAAKVDVRPCEPTSRPLPASKFQPLRTDFSLVASGSNLFVASAWGEGDTRRLSLARLERDGTPVWSTPVAPPGSWEERPALALAGSELGVAYGPPVSVGANVELAIFDAIRGTLRISRPVVKGQAFGYCLAARPGRYLLAYSRADRSFLLELGPNGDELASSTLPIVFTECALAPRAGGWLLVHKNSRTRDHLFAQQLDAGGRASGTAEDLGEGSLPVLLGQNDTITLAWTNHQRRRVTALELDPNGRPRGSPRVATRSSPMLGFGLIDDEGVSRLLYATRSGEYGERRLCRP